MGKERSYFYNVHDKVPEEFAPLMAAYMSYYKRTSNLSASNSSQQLKNCEPMIFRLLSFLYVLTLKEEKSMQGRSKTERRQMIIDKVTNDDGELMTPNEQLNFFADFVCKNIGQDIVVYFFNENDPNPIHRTQNPGEIKLSVIKWNNGKYAATSIVNIFGYNLKKIPINLELPGSRSNVYPVSDRVPIECHPLMAAYMSYILQSDDKNRSKRVKNVRTLLFDLLSLLGYNYNEMENPFRRYTDDFNIFAIGEFVRKQNGSIMNSLEQLNVFAKLLNEKGYKTDIYLYHEGNKTYITKTDIHEFAPLIIPIIVLNDGRLAGTSKLNSAVFDSKKRELRTETQNVHKQKKFKQNEKTETF